MKLKLVFVFVLCISILLSISSDAKIGRQKFWLTPAGTFQLNKEKSRFQMQFVNIPVIEAIIETLSISSVDSVNDSTVTIHLSSPMTDGVTYNFRALSVQDTSGNSAIDDTTLVAQ